MIMEKSKWIKSIGRHGNGAWHILFIQPTQLLKSPPTVITQIIDLDPNFEYLPLNFFFLNLNWVKITIPICLVCVE